MRTVTAWTAAVLLTLAAAAPRHAADKSAGVAIEVGKELIDFKIGNQLVGRYRIGPQVPKPYLWPLFAPGGVPITRAWPMEPARPGEATDHPHQKSAWFCHG